MVGFTKAQPSGRNWKKTEKTDQETEIHPALNFHREETWRTGDCHVCVCNKDVTLYQVS